MTDLYENALLRPEGRTKCNPNNAKKTPATTKAIAQDSVVIFFFGGVSAFFFFAKAGRSKVYNGCPPPRKGKKKAKKNDCTLSRLKQIKFILNLGYIMQQVEPGA